MNPTKLCLEQTAHGFQKGDVISLAVRDLQKQIPSTLASSVGIVTEAGPGPTNL